MKMMKVVQAILLIALSACGHAAPSPISAESMLREFRKVCWGINSKNLEVVTAKSGWKKFEPPPGSYFAIQQNLARAAADKITAGVSEEDLSSSDLLFSKQMKDRDIYVWLAFGKARNDDSEYAIMTCSLHDPSLVQEISLEQLTEFGGRRPESFGGDIAIAYRWVPGLAPGQVNTVALFIPKSSEPKWLALGTPAKGLVLKQQTIEKIS